MRRTVIVGEISGYQRRLEYVLASLHQSLNESLSHNEVLFSLQVASLSKQLQHMLTWCTCWAPIWISSCPIASTSLSSHWTAASMAQIVFLAGPEWFKNVLNCWSDVFIWSIQRKIFIVTTLHKRLFFNFSQQISLLIFQLLLLFKDILVYLFI